MLFDVSESGDTGELSRVLLEVYQIWCLVRKRKNNAYPAAYKSRKVRLWMMGKDG